MLITFEGIDASGKSTQIRLLAHRLEAEGVDFVLTKEPGGTAMGQKIRQILLDPANRSLTPQAELLLYLADRVQHLEEVIRPALAAGKLVLCDRYHDATLAYQGAGRGLDLAWMDAFAQQQLLRPALTLWFDISPAVSRKRLEQRNRELGQELCRLEAEDISFFTRIRQGYQALANSDPARFHRINGEANVEEVRAQVWDLVHQVPEKLSFLR